MKSLYTLTGILIVISAIGALFYGGYLGLVYIWQIYTELEFVVRTVLLSAMSVLVIGALIVASAIKSAAASKAKHQLANRKLDLYKALVDTYKPVFDSSVVTTSGGLDKPLSELETELQLLAATQVVELHDKLATALRDNESDEHTKTLFRKLIKAMRVDLGHRSGYEESKIRFLFVHSGDRAQTDIGQEAHS